MERMCSHHPGVTRWPWERPTNKIVGQVGAHSDPRIRAALVEAIFDVDECPCWAAVNPLLSESPVGADFIFPGCLSGCSDRSYPAMAAENKPAGAPGAWPRFTAEEWHAASPWFKPLPGFTPPTQDHDQPHQEIDACETCTKVRGRGSWTGLMVGAAPQPIVYAYRAGRRVAVITDSNLDAIYLNVANWIDMTPSFTVRKPVDMLDRLANRLPPHGLGDALVREMAARIYWRATTANWVGASAANAERLLDQDVIECGREHGHPKLTP